MPPQVWSRPGLRQRRRGQSPGASTVTQAAPDLLVDKRPAPKIAESDLEPVEGRAPQGGGLRETIPRPKPETEGGCLTKSGASAPAALARKAGRSASTALAG